MASGGTGLGLMVAAAGAWSRSGDPAGRRLGLGFVGVALGWLLLWFLVVAILFVRAIWATAHYAERVRPVTPPGDQSR